MSVQKSETIVYADHFILAHVIPADSVPEEIENCVQKTRLN